MLTSVGIFLLCYLTEATNSVIDDCSALLISFYSTNAESCACINHKLDVCMFTVSCYNIFLLIHSSVKNLSFSLCSMNHLEKSRKSSKNESWAEQTRETFFYIIFFYLCDLVDYSADSRLFEKPPLDFVSCVLFSLFSLHTDWNHSYKGHRTERIPQLHMWIFWHQHEIASFVCGDINHLPCNSHAIQLWIEFESVAWNSVKILKFCCFWNIKHGNWISNWIIKFTIFIKLIVTFRLNSGILC